MGHSIARFGRAVTFLALAVTLFGCAGTSNALLGFSPAPEANNGAGLIYFYRPDGPTLGTTPQVTIDDQPVMLLEKSSYTWMHLSEGQHHFEIDWPDHSGFQSELAFDLQVSHNEVAVVRVTTQINRSLDVYEGRYKLEAAKVAEVKGYREMYDCCEFSPSYHYGLGVAL